MHLPLEKHMIYSNGYILNWQTAGYISRNYTSVVSTYYLSTDETNAALLWEDLLIW